MTNLDQPADPQSVHQGIDGGVIASYDFAVGSGFSKRERTCIDLRIPESGDAELDALIEKARRQEMAGRAMEAMIVNAGRNGYKSATSVEIYRDASIAAGAVLYALEDA